MSADLDSTGSDAEGALLSPNIWGSPQTYETHNLALDRSGIIDAALLRLAGRSDWRGATVVELGCGTGFHLPRLAETARRVIGVEPHAPLADLARRRIAGMPSGPRSATAAVTVVVAGAQDTGLAAASVDVAIARWAYFFGPGCEPGLAELGRIMRPGGIALVVDNDATRSTFGSWFSAAWPDYDPSAVDRFWARQGWQRESLDVTWAFDSREDFEAVLRWEFPPAVCTRIFAREPERTAVDYAVLLRWRRY
ncbi:MAG TPA: class I SAM-dependent methyltransferase [Dermatophilaceae bacterium]|nr:class I SAM-dependent methyltransferase [Actinomycetales bacterium]HMT32531.1 class I SAM-dependent methyltransferase [Dermatophilaceae bacterium]HMT89144.1 class I SAM-dependent methyltransferase [Dermatophilaceae bacterium]